MIEEALQTAEKRKEAKSKGEKERHTHLNTEFHRIPRRVLPLTGTKETGRGMRFGKQSCVYTFSH